MDIVAAARDFVRSEARLVEARLFAVLFEGADPRGVVEALRGYQNPDGGFGHGLEPDKRCPDSQPLDVEFAFDVLLAAGVRDDAMVRRAADWLDTVSAPGGAVALLTPAIEGYPRAAHITAEGCVPGLNPTAGLVGRLHALGVDHPWRERAGAWCAEEIARGLPAEAHALREVMAFLERTGDVDLDRVRAHLPGVAYYRSDPADPSYGVTPLWFAPTPDSVWRPLFTDEQLDAHLDRLVADQQDDGGWALTWQPPSHAATLEYRGAVTVEALRTLRAYNRI